MILWHRNQHESNRTTRLQYVESHDQPHHCSIFVHPWYFFSLPGVAFFFKPQVTHKCAARLWNMCVMSWISVESLIKSSWKTINPQTVEIVFPRWKQTKKTPPETRPSFCPKRKWIIWTNHWIYPQVIRTCFFVACYSGKWLKEVQPTFALSNQISQQFSVNVLRTCCCEHRSALVMHTSNVYTAYTCIYIYIHTLHFIYTIYLLHFLTHVYMCIYIYIFGAWTWLLDSFFTTWVFEKCMFHSTIPPQVAKIQDHWWWAVFACF